MACNLTDKHGRKHSYLRLSLTDKCNFRCFYCMPSENIHFYPKSRLMTADEIETIARQFVDQGVEKIRLTGGEPLIRKDADEIIYRLSQLPIELAITTNGYLLDKYLELFQRVGLQSINISLDTLDEEKFHNITQRDYYYKVRSNIQKALKKGFKIKVNTVVMKGVNDEEILDFVRWSERENIHVRFIEFMPFNGNKWDWSKVVSYKEMLGTIENNIPIEKIEDSTNDTAKNYRVQGGKGTFAVISSITSPFCGSCNRVRLTADGKLKNCLFSSAETDLLTPLRNGQEILPLIQGNVSSKEKERGGLNFDKSQDGTELERERCMAKIGG